jgi:hypothetical protein
MSPRNRDVDPKTPATEAPVFTSGQYLYVWRKAVAEWVDLVDTAARETNDRQFKTIRATLGRQLYRALPTSHRSVVDEAQAVFTAGPRQVSLLGVADTLPEDAQRFTLSDPNPILDGGCLLVASRLSYLYVLRWKLLLNCHRLIVKHSLLWY